MAERHHRPYRLARGGAVTALALLPVIGGAPAVAVAPQPGATPSCVHATGTYTGAPVWAVRRFDPARVWPLATGSGVTVAMVGTGVDPGNGQFATGQVAAGFDALAGQGDGRRDCDGRGTFAAGLVAAQPDPRTPVVGLAPGVRLLPVRASQWMSDNQLAGDASALARAVSWASEQGAAVICVTVAVPQGSAQLRQAVQAAIGRGSVVVSSGLPGDDGRSYPSAYPGVMAVAGVDAAEKPLRGAEHGSHVAVAAPAANLWSLGAGAPAGAVTHQHQQAAPAEAAAFACATAALVRQQHPRLGVAQVVRRIEVTADRTSAARPDPGTGWGVVDPQAALATVLPEELEPSSTTGPAPEVSAAVLAARPEPGPSPRVRAVAWSVATAGVGLAAAAWSAMWVWRRGRARRWRPTRLPVAAARPTAPVAGAAQSASPSASTRPQAMA